MYDNHMNQGEMPSGLNPISSIFFTLHRLRLMDTLKNFSDF